MFGIGSMELLVILVVALLIFGPQRLPELARMLAKGMRELRRAADDIRSQVEMEEYLDKNPELLADDASAPPEGGGVITAVTAPEGTVAHSAGDESAGPDDNASTS